MKRLGILLVLAAALAVASDYSFSQGIQGFPCVGVFGSTTCSDGVTPGLRGNTGTTFSYATVAGHNASADGGGGSFVKLGAASSYCNTYSGVSGKGTVGKNTIGDLSETGFDITTLRVGELVTGGSSDGTVQVQPGTEIASNDEHNTITLTLPLTGTSTTTGVSMNITFTGDNNGTLIVDSESSTGGGPGPQCWQKTDYRGDPHEFGAYGDGVTNDTTAIQYWFGAYGNVNPNLAPATAPPNFGPWIATVPASYLVNSPLVCPQNATIQGPTNLSGQGTPRVGFVASPTFAGIVYPYPTPQPPPAPPGYFALQGVIGAMQYCRLSGIAVTGNGFELQTTGTTNGTSTVSVATLTNASGNVVQVGNAVAATDIPAGSVVTGTISSPCCSVTISQVPGSTLNETVTFYGPDAVDVLGKRVTIDGFSNLSQGRYNLFCGIPASGQELYGLQMKDSEATGSLSDNLYMPGPCPNVRLIGDIVTGSGGNGIYFGGTEGTISGGTIPQDLTV